jgi:hypothetical protein
MKISSGTYKNRACQKAFDGESRETENRLQWQAAMVCWPATRIMLRVGDWHLSVKLWNERQVGLETTIPVRNLSDRNVNTVVRYKLSMDEKVQCSTSNLSEEWQKYQNISSAIHLRPLLDTDEAKLQHSYFPLSFSMIFSFFSSFPPLFPLSMVDVFAEFHLYK